MADSNVRRAFYCQDELWQAFSNLAMQRRTSVDALINEAMTAYLQSSGMGVSSFGAPNNYGQAPMPPLSQGAPANAPNPRYGIPPAPSAAPQPPQPLDARVPPPAPSYRRPPSIFEDPIADNGVRKPMVLASLQNQPPQYQQPQGGYGVQPPPAPAQNNYSQPPLYIIFANQRYTVDKDKYIIGRSSQLADLVIRDANISRKHCAVIYKNGAYYIKDLDSTNGIEYKGNRIDTKRINEGDQFNICEFHFTFTYR